LTEGTLYFDGGIREGLMAYGWLLVDPGDETEIIVSGNRTCGEGTSNLAEYRALIAGLQGALKAGVDIVHIIGDSQLIIKQVIGAFRAKKPELVKHRDYVLELLGQFESYTIKWVPRRYNKRADSLVNEVFEKRKNKKCSKRK
jgi:ribonuclease HI